MRQSEVYHHASTETLVESVVQSLIDYIHENQLRVGDPILSEVEFTRQLGVSRTVVREAFKTLAALKIIEAGAGRRARVSPFDGSAMALTLSNALHTKQLTAQQVWDVRRSIEMRSVVLACMHRTERDAQHLLNLTERMKETCLDLPIMTEYDIEFHVAIAKATRNPLLPMLVSSLTSAIRDTNPIVWQIRKSEPERLEVVDWHIAIAEAIRAQDSEAAVRALSQHFDKAIHGLVNAGFN